MSVGGAAGGGLLAGKAKLAVAALVIVGGGGAAYAATGGDVPFVGGSSGMVDTVPEDVDLVMYVDSSLADDEATKALGEELGAVAGAGESSDSEALRESFEDEYGLSYDEFDSVVVFGQYPEDGAGSPTSQLAGAGYSAALIESSWAEDDFVDAAEEAPSGDATTVYEEDEYEGYTIYIQKPEEDDVDDFRQDTENPTYIGVISEGQYVVGSEDAVKDALDVDAGEEDSFSGDLRNAYDSARDGMVKFASTLPEDQVGSGMASQSAENVDVVAGSYYSSGSETVGMEVRMVTGDSSDAEDIVDQIDGAAASVEESVQDDDVVALVESVETSQDGSTAVVTFEADVDTIADGLEGIGPMMGGFGGGGAGGFSSSVAGPADSYGAVEAPAANPA